MRIVFMILNNTSKLDDLLTNLVHIGISGATVLQSTGMARILNEHDEEEIPFLNSLRSILNPERKKSSTIFAVIKDEQLEGVVDAFENTVGDLSKKDTGVVFSFPIDYIKGICGLEQ